MDLLDEIRSEAEQLAIWRVLPPHATRAEIAQAVSEGLGRKIAPNSTGALHAEACYNHIQLMELAS